MPHRLTWLDVFTERPMAGNALAVVHDADDLSDEAMLAFARETGLSETTFVQRPSPGGEADYRNRIFTIGGEIRFAGHPSLGTAVAVAFARGEEACELVQQTGAGLQPIRVRRQGMRAHASMLQEPAEFLGDADPATVLPALGLDPGDVPRGLGPALVSTGIKQLLVPLRDADLLLHVRPDGPALDAILREHGALVAYLFGADPEDGRVEARSFLVEHGRLFEDPGTGAAAGPLCAWMARHRGVPAIAIDQGVTMGRPCRIDAAMEGERPRVGGDVVLVSDGQLLL